MQSSVARASEGDFPRLAELFSAYRSFFSKIDDVVEAERFLRERMAADESVIFVARQADVPVGFIQLYPLWSSWYCKRIWFLSDLYVDEAWRGRGIGAHLVDAVKDFAMQTGASSAMVELPKSEPHLEKFYAGLGFARDEVFDLARYYP
ncbi:MAG: GNAT family N-acetyltransferase [Candidatus Eremiobacteraeota bacterium]|nr:GNAT family N-acetyltransferase [Candidatus Eremiobacteraeota bacterium]